MKLWEKKNNSTFKDDTKTASRWQQVTVLMIESLIDSVDSLRMADSFISEASDCHYEWFIESLTSSFSSESHLCVALNVQTVICLKIFSIPKYILSRTY